MLRHYFRQAVRGLVRDRWFTLGVALTLGFGIGANTAIFTISNALLNRSTDFPEQERLVSVLERKPQGTGSWSTTSVATFLDWRRESRSLERLAAYAWWDASLSGIGEPAPVKGYRVSPSFFEVLGVAPSAGRGFTGSEGDSGGGRVVVLSDGLARKLFQDADSALGSPLRLNGVTHEVVGVMPASFRFPLGGTELWVPLVFDARERSDRTSRHLSVVARLASGASVDSAQSEMDGIAVEIATDYPETNRGWGITVQPLEELVVGPFRPFVLLLTGVVGFVLLIACVNVSILHFARASGREMEIATRSSLGARRRSVVSQLLVESVVLSLVGGAVAWGIGYLGMEAIRARMPGALSKWLPGWEGVGMNQTVFWFTLAVALTCGVVCGLAPALQLSRTDLSVSLKGSGLVGRASRSRRWQEALVVAEVVLAVALLVGTGVMVDAFRTLTATNGVSETDHLLAAHLVLPDTRYEDLGEAAAFYSRLVDEVEALPGVTGVAAVNYMPFAALNGTTAYSVEGATPPPDAGKPRTNYRTVSPRFFETIGLPLRRGRDFTDADRPDSLPVVIVSEKLAGRIWPGEDPLGKRLKAESSQIPDRWLTVVGVVTDVRHSWLDTEMPTALYLPMMQSPGRRMDVLARVDGDPMALAGEVRSIVGRLDPDQPVHSLQTMERAIEEVMAGLAFVVVLMVVASGLALLLASIGIYSVTTYLVQERSREMGIRVAVGAAPGQIVALVVGRGLRLMAGGLAIGALVGFAVARVIASIVYGVKVLDVPTLAVVVLALTASALLASYLPARSVAGADPMLALRME